MATKVIVANQQRIRIATEGAVLFLVHLLEQNAHVVVNSRLQVLEQLLLGHVHQTQFQGGAGFSAKHHIAQANPRGLQRLKIWVMHDGVQLVGQNLIDLRNALIDHRDHAFVRRTFHALIQNLGRKLTQKFLGIDTLRGLGSHFSLLDDSIQEAQFLVFYRIGADVR